MNTTVSNDGLVHLKGLTKLQTLYLVNTRITDAGLVHLEGLPATSRNTSQRASVGA